MSSMSNCSPLKQLEILENCLVHKTADLDDYELAENTRPGFASEGHQMTFASATQLTYWYDRRATASAPAPVAADPPPREGRA